ncbi:MAG: class I SAM-dependent methyltransferase [Caldilineaceae bacterium]|nr:class I SAM-dependent methyltransferase [Caldilineaceae bacterium]
MAAHHDPADLRTHFQAQYTERISRAERLLEERALGHAVGLHGYTTLAQAQLLAEVLALGPSDLLLDLGTGRGWPGLHLARTTGCQLLALDIPLEAVGRAHAAMEPARAGRLCAGLVADGRAVPLGPHTVDAVVHADSF